MNESRCTPSWMSHVTYECGMSRINESCNIWISVHVNYLCHPYEYVMSHTWISHVTHANESWHTYEWVMAHIWVSHVSWVTSHSESWHTCEWVMAHMWMSHGTHVNDTHVNESWHTCKWVMAHIWMGHGTHMNESCLVSHVTLSVMSNIWNQSCRTYKRVMLCICMSHVWHVSW